MLIHLPVINWSLATRLEYLVFFFAPLIFVLFLRSLYPKDIHRWFIWIVAGFGIGFSLLLFADPLTFSYSVTFYQGVILLEMLYFLFFLGRIAVKRREGAGYIVFASFIVFAAIIIETLVVQGIIDQVYIANFLPMGQITAFSFLAFIFVQAILLSSRFSKSFARIETLSVELEEVNVNLLESERKYRTIFEESKDMIFIAGLDAQIEDVSPACEELLGYTKAELVQVKVLDVIADQADSIRFQKAIVEQGSVLNFEAVLQRKDGQMIHTLVSATPRLGEDGKITGVQGNVRDISERKQAEAERIRALELEQIAITDPLTKVYNRRFFFEVAEKEIERAKRSISPLSIILLDIDHFKIVNDSYGHLTGDEVLINLANLCQGNIRSMDIFARLGGEEFVILMPDSDSESAKEIAERLRGEVDGKPMAVSENANVSITISLGIADWHSNNPMEITNLLDRADQALYKAKECGRNQAIVWEDGINY